MISDTIDDHGWHAERHVHLNIYRSSCNHVSNVPIYHQLVISLLPVWRVHHCIVLSLLEPVSALRRRHWYVCLEMGNCGAHGIIYTFFYLNHLILTLKG